MLLTLGPVLPVLLALGLVLPVLLALGLVLPVLLALGLVLPLLLALGLTDATSFALPVRRSDPLLEGKEAVDLQLDCGTLRFLASVGLVLEDALPARSGLAPGGGPGLGLLLPGTTARGLLAGVTAVAGFLRVGADGGLDLGTSFDADGVTIVSGIVVDVVVAVVVVSAVD
jgi:hypothetical protein